VMGSLGALLAFTSRDDVDFFSHLEMYMRQEHPPLCGRDHMGYRSAYFPVKVICIYYSLLYYLLSHIIIHTG
jgi:splicing factor 3B subunit 3